MDVGIDLLAFKAATADIYDLYPALILLLQQNIFRFQVAVNYLLPLEEVQSLEDLDRKPSDQIQREPREVGLFDEFVEVFVENLKFEAGVAPKNE